MAYIIDYLERIEKSLETMVTSSGKELPSSLTGMDTVAHLEYVTRLLGTMVSAETYETVMGSQHDNVGMGIEDRCRAIAELFESGEISVGTTSEDNDNGSSTDSGDVRFDDDMNFTRAYGAPIISANNYSASTSEPVFDKSDARYVIKVGETIIFDSQIEGMRDNKTFEYNTNNNVNLNQAYISSSDTYYFGIGLMYSNSALSSGEGTYHVTITKYAE